MAGKTTKDYFLDRGFCALQFRKEGHRSGLDAILLAATIPQTFSGRVADFGAGAGVVGMAVAHRCANAKADLFELDPALVSLARRSIEIEANRHLADRVEAHHADVAMVHKENRPVSYDWVLSNPPYNDASHRQSPDPGRAMAHSLVDGAPEQWLKSAAGVLCSKGKISLIIRPANLTDFLVPLQKRFGNIVIKAIHSTVGGAASKLLIGAVKGSKAPTRMLSPLIIHDQDSSFTSEAEDIFRGRSSISLIA